MNKKWIPIALIIAMFMLTPVAFACDDNTPIDECPVDDSSLAIDKTAVETGELTANVTLFITGAEVTKQTPADVVFAIDSSGSMSWNDQNALRKDAVKNFVDQLDPTKDKVGVVNWDNNIQSFQPLTDDFDAAKGVVDAGYDGGSTDMNLAIDKSIELLDADSSLSANQKFIILLTDGEWNTGKDPLTNSVVTAISKGYAVYTIGLGTSSQEALLKTIATDTGGKYYFATDASVLNDIYDQIFQDITMVASNLKVEDIIPDYMTYVDGSATIQPDSIDWNNGKATKLTWIIPQLSADDTWSVTYSLISSIYGEDIPTNVEAKVTYTNPEGCPGEQFFPIPLVSWDEPIIPPEPPEEPVIPEPQPEPVEEVSAQGVPMQETGATLFPLIAGLVMVLFGGLGLRKH